MYFFVFIVSRFLSGLMVSLNCEKILTTTKIVMIFEAMLLVKAFVILALATSNGSALML